MMGLTSKSIRILKEALPTGAIIVFVKKNGNTVHDSVNDRGFEVTLRTRNEIMYYSPHTMRHYGSIMFEHFDECSVSKSNIVLDNCIIAIRKKGHDNE